MTETPPQESQDESAEEPPSGSDLRYLLLSFLGAFALTGAFALAQLLYAVHVLSTGGTPNASDPFYSFLTRLGWSADVVFVLIFYWIGAHLDFRKRWGLLALLTFAGTLLGNLPGDIAILTNSIGAVAGYTLVTDPLSLSNLFVGSFTAFTVPFAGLGLAFMVRQAPRELLRSVTSLTFLAAGFLIMLAYYVNFEVISPQLVPLYNALAPASGQITALELELSPGAPFEYYVGWVFFPVLAFVVFYLLGRRFSPSRGLRGLALTSFVGAALAYAIGVPLNTSYEYAAAGYQLPVSLSAGLIQGAVTEGFYFLAFALSAVSLGLARAEATSAHPARPPELGLDGQGKEPAPPATAPQ